MRTKILFFDLRDIECGRLSWQSADGRAYGVAHPPLPQVDVHALPQRVPYGIRFAAQPASKTGPVQEYPGWGRVVYDGGLYRAWYLAINGHSKLGSGCAAYADPPACVEICCAESDDGFQWRVVHRCPIQVPGQSGFDGITFFLDPHAPPQERYKFVYCARFAKGLFEQALAEYLGRPARHRDWRLSEERRSGMFAAVSGDGLDWQAIPEPLTFHASDTDTSVFWDERIERYVMYSRLMREGRRWIGRAETDDFGHWGPVLPVVWPRLDDPPDYDFYLNGYTRYPGLPEFQLMFPMVWHRYTERSEVRLYSSDDGAVWHQVPGGPVLEPGDAGAWDTEFIGSGKDLVPFGRDQVAIPYSGTPFPHKYPRWPAVWDAWKQGWAHWPRDRICALKADRVGEFWTVPILPAGRTIRLNFRTPMAGEIRVGIEGAAGRSIEECDPLVGDHAAKPVTWRGNADIGIGGEQPVSLHIRLCCADLFAVNFE